jgi:hypothetical protein
MSTLSGNQGDEFQPPMHGLMTLEAGRKTRYRKRPGTWWRSPNGRYVVVLSISLAALIISIANSLAIAGDLSIPLPGMRGASPASSDHATYNFENGVNGWGARGAASAVVSTSAYAFAGQRALQVHVAAVSSSNEAFIYNAQPASAGQRSQITAYVYVPRGAPALFATLFVLDHGYRWFSGPYPALSAGSWTLLLFDVPPQASLPIHQLGVMIVGGKGQPPYSGAIYLDSVNVQPL